MNIAKNYQPDKVDEKWSSVNTEIAGNYQKFLEEGSKDEEQDSPNLVEIDDFDKAMNAIPARISYEVNGGIFNQTSTPRKDALERIKIERVRKMLNPSATTPVNSVIYLDNEEDSAARNPVMPTVDSSRKVEQQCNFEDIYPSKDDNFSFTSDDLENEIAKSLADKKELEAAPKAEKLLQPDHRALNEVNQQKSWLFKTQNPRLKGNFFKNRSDSKKALKEALLKDSSNAPQLSAADETLQ